jgi:hypothetical protein
MAALELNFDIKIGRAVLGTILMLIWGGGAA